jgi:alpha-tubulin suppressor-like RCC1 family protein
LRVEAEEALLRPQVLIRLACLVGLFSAALILAAPTPQPVAAFPATSTTSPPANEYVALGDSYSSGEGLKTNPNNYISPSGPDGCHRASDAFPVDVAESLNVNASAFEAYGEAFVACSGSSTTAQIAGANGEPTQLNALSQTATKFVTVTAGGDDLPFATTFPDCMRVKGKVLGTPTIDLPVNPTTACQSSIVSAEATLTTLSSTLANYYSKIIADAAPGAIIEVLNYPQLFPSGAVPSFCPVTSGVTLPPVPGVTSVPSTWYLGLSKSVIAQFNTLESQLNGAIAQAVRDMKSDPNIHLLNINRLEPSSAQTCNTKTDSSAGINGVTANTTGDLSAFFTSCIALWILQQGCSSGFGDYFDWKASFHPKKSLHEHMAVDAERAIARGSSGSTLSGVSRVIGDGNGFCALLSSGRVDCWGKGDYGQLGNGVFYTSGNLGSAIPVQVEGVGGTGILGSVADLTSDGVGYCARLTSGGVDCWGDGNHGQLGDGVFHTSGNQGSAIPVQVEGVGGIGILSDVASLTSDRDSQSGYCARLTSGGVDCWGEGTYGQLGDGVFHTSGNHGSAIPVQVEGVGGTGILSGVADLTSDGYTYCALLSSGGVDCWGEGNYGQLGNGIFYTIANYGTSIPVQVEGIGGTGNLSGVTSLSSDGNESCALLSSGGVDCWGYGYDGELGNGVFYTNGNYGSAVPVQVDGVGGTGLLGGVAGLSSDENDSNCALLTSGAVDCWGYGHAGELGNGVFYTSGNEGSAVPVQVEGVGGTGVLSGADSLSIGGDLSYCALLTTDAVDCWGYGYDGELGNGTFYTGGNYGSAFPVQVEDLGGTGILGGAVGVISDEKDSTCALLSTGDVDCWGYGYNGELGDGVFYTSGNQGSAVPVQS